MANNNEPAKQLIPYLQRADELQNHHPLVSYYCRLYAMERGLKIPQSDRTKNTNSILAILIKLLEKDKKSLKLSPDDHLQLEEFALNVFTKADKQDRAGRADISTAKTFYAASIFFEILNQFGELEPDLEQKQKYAAWKAADIRKALKEGRRPVPGAPCSKEDSSTPSSAPSSHYDVEPRPTGRDINPGPELDKMPSAQFPDALKRQPSTDILQSPPSFPSGDYPSHDADCPSHNADYSLRTPDCPSHDYQSGHNFEKEENPTYPPPHQTQSPQKSQHLHQVQQNYHPRDVQASNSYPNFQSYPSFSESSLPATPSHYPSYYQGSVASCSHQSTPSMTNYASAPQYSSSGKNGSVQVQDVPTTVQPLISSHTYHYDSNYQPPPEKVAEAQKAARFAVGSLAYDEVPVAVEHLKKALEYLTNPSAG